jgi:hypothetical protein
MDEAGDRDICWWWLEAKVVNNSCFRVDSSAGHAINELRVSDFKENENVWNNVCFHKCLSLLIALQSRQVKRKSQKVRKKNNLQIKKKICSKIDSNQKKGQKQEKLNFERKTDLCTGARKTVQEPPTLINVRAIQISCHHGNEDVIRNKLASIHI